MIMSIILQCVLLYLYLYSPALKGPMANLVTYATQRLVQTAN